MCEERQEPLLAQVPINNGAQHHADKGALCTATDNRAWCALRPLPVGDVTLCTRQRTERTKHRTLERLLCSSWIDP
jgi:hypothetical protein